MGHARMNAMSSALLIFLIAALPLTAQARGGHNNNGGQIKSNRPIAITKSKAAGTPKREHEAKMKRHAKAAEPAKAKETARKADDAAAKASGTAKSNTPAQATTPANATAHATSAVAAAAPVPAASAPPAMGAVPHTAPAAPIASIAPPVVGGTFRSGAIVADSGGLLKPVVTPSNSKGAAKYFDVFKDDARVIGHYAAAGAHEVASVAKASASTAASAAKSVYHFIGGLF
jgi:hypothetical protein